MKKNLNVFVGVILCALLCGLFVWLSTSEEEQLGWNPNEEFGAEGKVYSGGASYTNATFVAPASEGLALQSMSSRSTARPVAVSSYAGSSYSAGATVSYSGGLGVGTPSAGGGLYATSSAVINSYGGGGNNGGAVGGGARGGMSSGAVAQGGGAVAIASPITYTSTRRGATNMPEAVVNEDAMSVAAASMAAPAANGASLFGAYTGMYGGAVLSAYNPMSAGYNAGRAGISGRRKSAPTLGDSSWWVWFDTWTHTGENGVGYQDKDGNYWFNDQTLEEVYNDFLANFWNEGMGIAPTFDQWKAWYFAATGGGDGAGFFYEGTNSKYFWGELVPVGDILPLVLIALLYVLFVAIKSRSLQSLLKAERSK